MGLVYYGGPLRRRRLKIYLIRHGDADAEIPEGLGDEARVLTTRGRQVASAHFEALAERMEGLQLVCTSPLVRAVQTSEILVWARGEETPVRVHRGLLPDMPSGPMTALIEEHAGADLALVGHQPSLGAVAAHLLRIPVFPKPVVPGAVIALRLDRDNGAAAKLLFYSAPGQAVAETLDEL